MGEPDRLPSSFRDPSGFLFRRDGVLYRQVEQAASSDYESTVDSGLYEDLIGRDLLVPHREVPLELAATPVAYRVIQPEVIRFISYPYEWCFSQLQDAALTTLAVQRRALEHELTLRDASAYNVQFRGTRPVFIDSLSFGEYVEGEPWIAYRQFCQHFLAPLALMSYRDIRLGQLLRVYLDGVPLDLACRLLPARTRLRFALLAHLHLHSRSQRKHAASKTSAAAARRARVSRNGLVGLLDSLEGAVRSLSWQPGGTQWSDYYDDTNYSSAATDHKQELLGKMLDRISPATVWDLGANTGLYSRVAAAGGSLVVSWDVDPAAVEKNYLLARSEPRSRVLPLVLDLTNPSAGLGWANSERAALAERGPTDALLALALVHHLAISNNVPLERIAEFFATLCRFAIVEFVPKEDSQVQRLLASRKDIFPNYRRESFERAFEGLFFRRACEPLRESKRHLYLWERRQ